MTRTFCVMTRYGQPIRTFDSLDAAVAFAVEHRANGAFPDCYVSRLDRVETEETVWKGTPHE